MLTKLKYIHAASYRSRLSDANKIKKRRSYPLLRRGLVALKISVFHKVQIPRNPLLLYMEPSFNRDWPKNIFVLKTNADKRFSEFPYKLFRHFSVYPSFIVYRCYYLFLKKKKTPIFDIST